MCMTLCGDYNVLLVDTKENPQNMEKYTIHIFTDAIYFQSNLSIK